MDLLSDPGMTWARAFLGVHASRLRAAWRDGDRGASAVELAVISAFLCVLAVVVLVVIKNFVNKEKGYIKAPKP